MSATRPRARHTPLVVIASADAAVADALARRLRRQGVLAYATHSAEGCLRVATSVRPDVVLLDPALPDRLDQLLRAHPVSSGAQLRRLSLAALDATSDVLAACTLPAHTAPLRAAA